MRKITKWFLCLVLVMAVVCGAMTAFAQEQTYVAENVQTGQQYADLTTAALSATEGQTVKLLQNADAQVLTVVEGTTLDLNGYELKAVYASVFGHMVDTSAANTGALKVDDNKLLINTENKQLPVKTDKGYQFVEVVGFNTTWMNENTFVFQPMFEAAANTLLKNGVANTGVTIQVNVTWKPYEGSEDLDSRTFKYGDNFVTQFVNSYNASTGKYGKMFTLTLVDPQNYVDLSCSVQVVSTTRVVFAPAPAPAEVTEEVQLTSEQASAVVPVGAKLTDSDVELTLTTEELDTTTVVVGEGEEARAMDIHVDGLAEDNTVPVIVTVNEMAPEFMNRGNIALYHVENGEAVEMTRVYTVEEVDEHNEYYYDIETGTVTMAMASFSEVTAVSSSENVWNGGFEDFKGEGTANDPYIIANADQLAKMSKLVSTDENYASAHYKLVADVNFGGAANAESSKNKVFYPIGYWKVLGQNNRDEDYYGFSNAFSGTFDGNGNTISGIYQNTWIMDGDYDDGYYKAAMGLFGAVYNATIKNLTIDNFQSDGEYAPTGCVAAYAGGKSTFENIYLTNCNPRVYNTGNGGIVGLNYNSTSGVADNLIFRNITVDETNKITALWGSWDVSCGGILGRVRENSKHDGTNTEGQVNTVTMVNCHVSAIIDVYNDVCANYQYYQYRYCGMLVGTIDYITDVAGVEATDVLKCTDCTVTYGDWNEYWYCELVANSLASYTHDYQFSRLEKISAVTDIKDENGNWIKAGNFVIPATNEENATCYHIVNKEGELVEHKHEYSGYDEGYDVDGDGNDDLKENRQHYYLPFHQLFTGYGWGATMSDDFDGVTVKEGGNAKATQKFTGKSVESLAPDVAVKIGDLFDAVVVDSKISMSTIQVFVSPADENSTVSGAFAVDADVWKNGTLTISGTGAAKITITDYIYCVPTTIIVTVDYANSVILHDAEGVRTLKFNDSIKLPEGSKYEDYTFYGWSEVLIEDVTSTEPTTVIKAETEYNKEGTNHLYAVYSYAETSEGSTTYEKYSGTLTEGDYVIVYSNGAMNTTINNSRLGYTNVTISNNKIVSDFDADIIWHIAPNGDYWTICNKKTGTYAAATGTKNQAVLSNDGTDDKSLWTASGSSVYEFINKANKAKSINANLRRNGTYGFATYATSTGGALTLYKAVTTPGELTNYYISICSCSHSNTITESKEATCTTAGYKSVTCLDCGSEVSREDYPVIEHNYVDGYCTMCQKVESDYSLVTKLADVTNGDYVIVVNVNGTYYAMNTVVNDNDKIAPVNVQVENEKIESENVPIWTISVSDDGISLNNGSTYLKGSGSSNTDLGTSTTAFNWAIKDNEDGTFTLTSSAGRLIMYNSVNNANVFGHYASSNYSSPDYFGDLYLFKVGSAVGCNHENTTTVTTEATCAKDGSIVTTCLECGHVTTETISAIGHNYVDGYCSVCEEAKVEKPEIPENGVYQLVTDIAEITAGGKFVVVAEVNNISYAMNTYNNGQISNFVVNVADDKVTTEDAPTWTIVKCGMTNAIVLSDTQYLKHGSSTDLAGDSVPYEWTITAGTADGTFQITTENRAIAYRSGATYMCFRAYTSLTETTEYHPNLKFYKLVEDSGSAGETKTKEIKIAGSTGKLAADSNSIAWDDADFTITSTKGSNAIRTEDTGHFRVYQNAEFTIKSKDGQSMTKIVFTCTSDGYASALETALKNKGYTATASNSVVTVEIEEGISEIIFKAGAQIRIVKFEITYFN